MLARRLSARQVDLAKTYNLIPREAYFALAAEAGKLGLELSGHVPGAVTVVEAARAGQKTIEHARAIIYDCSAYGEAYRETIARASTSSTKKELDDYLRDAPELSDAVRLSRAVDEYEEGLCRRFFPS